MSKVKKAIRPRHTVPPPLEYSAFLTMQDRFLQSLDDEKEDEAYDTKRGFAEEVLKDLERFLFAEALDRAERHAQYLALKAEFEPETAVLPDGAKRPPRKP